MSLNHLTRVDDAVADKLNIGCNQLKSNKIQVQEVVLDNTDGSTTTLKLPDQGSAGYALKSNGSGSVFWSPDQVSSGGIIYSGNKPASLNKFLKINSTDGSSAVESSISENQLELNLNNLQIKNMTDPTDDQDAVTRKYLEDNPQNPFDQDLNTTSSVEFTNEVVVSNGVNNDNFYFKDEETKACIQHKVSGTRYNIVEALNNGEISIGDSNVPSTPDCNLYFDNVNMGSISLFNSLNPLAHSIGSSAQPYGTVYTNTLYLTSIPTSGPDIIPKISIDGTEGADNQILWKGPNNKVAWGFRFFYMSVAASDETTTVLTGLKSTFRFFAGLAVSVQQVFVSLNTPQVSGNLFKFDVTRNGNSIFSSQPTLNNGSSWAEISGVQGQIPWTVGDEIKISVITIGDGTATGFKVYFRGFYQ